MLSVKIGQYHPSLENSFVNTIQALKKDDPLTPVAVVAPTNWMLNRLQERLVLGQDASISSIYRNFKPSSTEILHSVQNDKKRRVQHASVCHSEQSEKI